jgi:hypothetical protein
LDAATSAMWRAAAEAMSSTLSGMKEPSVSAKGEGPSGRRPGGGSAWVGGLHGRQPQAARSERPRGVRFEERAVTEHKQGPKRH